MSMSEYDRRFAISFAKTAIATILALGLWWWASNAHCQELSVADGSSSGTYKAFFNDLKRVCGDTIPMVEVTDSSGAVENLDHVIGNEANAAFLHSDIILYRSRTEDLSSIKTLMPLFKEDVHFVTMNKPFVTSAGHFGFGGSSRTLNTVSDLTGLTIGAAGGGYITAKLIQVSGEVSYNVQQMGSGDEVLSALRNGNIAAGVFVGAAPLPNLKNLGGDFKILTVNETVRERLKSVYKPSTVTYTKMSTSPVTTVAATALLITRQYKTPKFVAAISAFHQCLISHLDELKETRGVHRAWQQVSEDQGSPWPLFPFTQVAESDPPPQPQAPVRVVQPAKKHNQK